MFNASCGVPVTVVASLMVALTLNTSPALSVLFWMPVAPVMATVLTVGASVSIAWLSKLARFAATAALPAASVAPLATRLSSTLPAATLAVGSTFTV